MEIISGKQLADTIRSELKASNLKNGLSPCLAMLEIGGIQENTTYINLKQTAVKEIGGEARLISIPGNASPVEVLAIIGELNHDRMVHGILLQLPVPVELEPYKELFLEEIVPYKDVDGFCPRNRGLLLGSKPDFISCAAEACLDVARRCFTKLAGRRVLLVGNSFDVIQPLVLLFIKEESHVTVLPDYNPEQAMDCDIIIIEHGHPLEVTSQGIKDGALVIDAGFHWFNNRTCGNVDREAMINLEGYLLPVPGGLGPLLIAHLMQNLCRAAQNQ